MKNLIGKKYPINLEQRVNLTDVIDVTSGEAIALIMSRLSLLSVKL